LTEEQSGNLSSEKKQEVADELGDALISLVQLSDKLGIDLIAAGIKKLKKLKLNTLLICVKVKH
jgi:NTP pyrophosphatase (non-canonical NTP hydrolase)